MSKQRRRDFLKTIGTGALAAASLPLSIRNLLAIPARNEKRSIEDIEHIVILMRRERRMSPSSTNTPARAFISLSTPGAMTQSTSRSSGPVGGTTW
jgi:hypothetical protein